MIKPFEVTEYAGLYAIKARSVSAMQVPYSQECLITGFGGSGSKAMAQKLADAMNKTYMKFLNDQGFGK